MSDLQPTSELPEVSSGTGWPEAQQLPEVPSAADPPAAQRGPAMTVPTPATPKDDAGGEPRPKRRGFLARRASRWTGRAFWLSVIAGAVVILLLLTTVLGRWPHIGNPFKAQTIDRSQPVLLVSIQDLARFEAASGNFQVVVDIQQDQKFIPDIIFSQRSLFVAAGSVDAYVDFSNVGPSEIVASADRKTVTINLPAPQLDQAHLDLSRSYVYSSSSGLVNKFADIFGGDPNKERELYLYATQKITAAAVDSQLGARAATNTKAMLTELMHSLGFTTVTINFAAS